MAPSTSKSINEGSQQYPYPSNVDVASFDEIEQLADNHSSYLQWQQKMLNLIKNYNMSGFIDGTINEPQMSYRSKTRAGAFAFATTHGQWKKSDTLVRKWILDSLSEDVRGTVDDLKTANDIWNALKAKYNTITHENSNEGIQYTPAPAPDPAAPLAPAAPPAPAPAPPAPAPAPPAPAAPAPPAPAAPAAPPAPAAPAAPPAPAPAPAPPAPAPAPTVPLSKEFDKYIKLRNAIDTGDWEIAEGIFNRDRKALIGPIDQDGNTALRIAISNLANILFLEKLLSRIDRNYEEVTHILVDALRYAIVRGNKVAVQMLVHMDPRLFFAEEGLPLVTAAKYSQRTIFYYLFKACQTKLKEIPLYDIKINPFQGAAAFKLLTCTISAGFLDVAYYLVVENYFRELEYNNYQTDIQEALCLLAEKRDEYQSAKQYNSCQRFFYAHVPIENCCGTRNNPNIKNQETNRANLGTWKSNVDFVMERIYVGFWKALRHAPLIKCLHDDKVKHNKALTVLKFICEKLEDSKTEHYEKALILAVENDIPEVIQHINEQCPESIPNTMVNDHTLFELSIMHRSENVYNYFLMHNSVNVSAYFVDKAYQEIRDSFKFPWDNLLHIAGKLAPQNKLNMITGAALQMQRELQWFQMVCKLVPNNEREAKTKEKETPIMVFRKEHEDLRKKGEEWMKSTANSYTITAILIVTIAFAAAITVPGGTNGDTGKAVYKTKLSFIVFIVSDAISFFTSTTSLLLFLSILTARYAEDDFLYKLPRSLIFGLFMLFMSVTTMLIAFSATLYIMYGQDNWWILIIIVVITCLPIGLFVTLELPLLKDLIYSTYGRGTFANLSALRIAS